MAPDGRPRGPEPALINGYLTHRRAWYLVGPGGERTRDNEATDWRLKLDPNNVGMAEGWAVHGLPSDAVPAEVPGVWNTLSPGYAGVAWYEALCHPDVPLSGTVRLVIGGANYQTDAWLNGVYLGRHEGGYDAFSFRCTDVIRRGENRVTLRIVDPPMDGEIDGLRLRECPTAKESWYGGVGGPWDHIWFEQSAPVWIESVQVQGDLPRRHAVFRIALASSLAVPVSVDLALLVETPGLNTTVEVAPTGTVVTQTVEVPEPRPWSPESPETYLWSVRLRLGCSEWRDAARVGTFGFRTCEWRDGVFYLNGVPRYLKGALLQPTYPRTLLMPPGDLATADVRLASEVGLNLIRCHLRPPPPGFLTRCDAQGMMAYVEPPLAWIEPSGRLLEHGERELAAMVRACGNHPSVVLWGIFNENAKATEAVGGELMAELARLDPTRPIVENSGGSAVGEVGMWAWGGQTRCWSPGWEAPRPLNDVHIYLANPLRKEARELMATVGDRPTLDVTPGRSAEDRIESRLSAGAVLVSEYGCGALPDFEAALAAFGEETHLADAVLLRELRESLEKGLAERGLDREIGDVASLVQQTQALQAEGIVAQTAALRRNPNVSGLILTQLADAGWEQMAGLVGLWRHPRPALAAFKRALEPYILHVEVDDPCSTGRVQTRTWLLSEPGLPPLREPAVLFTAVESATPPHQTVGHTGAMPVRLPLRHAPRRGTRLPGVLDGGPLNLMTLSLPSEPGVYQIRKRLKTEGRSDEAVCTVRRLPDREHEPGEGLVLLGSGLRGALPAAQTELPTDWTGPILAHLPTRPSRASLALAVERARAGAHLCLVGMDLRSAVRLVPLLGLPICLQSGRGNFMGVHHYVREHPLFDGLGAPCLADATFAEVLPAWVAEELPGAEVLAGCFTVPDGGRGFRWRASVQTLPFDRGRLTLCQLGVGERQGGALGRYLLDRLVRWMR